MKAILFWLTVAIALPAFADGEPTGSYVPLQPGHWGNWYNPDAPGEGIELSLIETADGNLIFAQVYLIRDGVQVWHSGQADWSEARDPLARDYEIQTFARSEVGGAAERTGTIWLRPDGYMLRLTAAVGGELWHATLYQLTKYPGAYIGECRIVQFSPPNPALPPLAPVGWCHAP
jgi:hypothetical protein